ncbi:MAG: DUF1580 domain-containing protein [Planctomycetaceae bacterium]|nr:DUF1580 domain-containing protein [Planctomycetaceae bacterium]
MSADSNLPIDPTRDQLIPIREACKSLPKRPSPSTIFRWLRQGANGVRLSAVRIGSEWFTTKECFRSFVAAQTSAVLGGSEDPNTDLDDDLRHHGLL